MKSRTLGIAPALGAAWWAAFVVVSGCSSTSSDPKVSSDAGDASTSNPQQDLHCEPEKADCDHDPSNGCEAILTVDVQNCGSCGTICGSDHGVPTCDHRLCRFACDADYANCDGNDFNGCEAYLPEDPQNCSQCNIECPFGKNQRPTCTAGACGTVCLPGNDDCNHDIRDGCEENLETPEACGSCQHVCGKYLGVPGCKSAACQWNCDATYAHCGPDDSLGCSVNLLNDPMNCGQCGVVCPLDKPNCSSRMCTK